MKEIKAPTNIEMLRECAHANPLILESWAQHFERDGLSVWAAHVRLLNDAIHDPLGYVAAMKLLQEEVRLQQELLG